MKNIISERQQIYVNAMTQRFHKELQDLDDVERKCVDEVLKAISMGCCLKRPRVFAGKEITAFDFQQISRTIPYEFICVAVQALAAKAQKGDLYNRVWYILGIVVQTSCTNKPVTRVARNSYQRRVSDHNEKIYSPEELHSIVLDMGMFSDADL